MKIACLQFAPQVGDVDNNLNRADSVLSKANIGELDILILPELAFSGYNFRSLQHISPYLEPTTSGITSLWARTTALKYNCIVTAGYPEKVDLSPKWPASPEYYNSAITVNADGETIANYRKSFLYYTDETWALEGPEGFYHGVIEPLGNVAMGICMDIKFEASWNAWEFAYHILYRETNLVILSMAWRTREEARSFSRAPKEPDMETLSYWISRLEPLIRNEGEEEIICVFANRTGTEDEAVYAGTSAVLGIQSGEVKVYGILGRGERELLVVDTSKRPKYQLISEPKSRPRTSNTKKTESKPQPPSGDFSDDSVKSVKSGISGSTAGSSSAISVSTANSSSGISVSTAGSSSGISVSTADSSSGISVSTTGSSSAISVSTASSSSGISVSTASSSIQTPTTAIQPPDDIIFTPISPIDDPVIQSYFGDQPLYESPMMETKPEPELARKQTPNPDPPHAVDRSRRATPIPASAPSDRPVSPKSRNCSRSRGPDGIDSPLLGSIISQNVRPTVETERTLEKVRKNLADVRRRCGPRPSRSHASKTNARVHSSSVGGVSQALPPGLLDLPKVDDAFESMFTRNCLGPRHRHILPRPRSTVW